MCNNTVTKLTKNDVKNCQGFKVPYVFQVCLSLLLFLKTSKKLLSLCRVHLGNYLYMTIFVPTFSKGRTKLSSAVALWGNDYHYCTISINKAWTQVLRRFRFWLHRIGDLRWWEFLKMVPAGNKATYRFSVNHTTKTIHHHDHHHHHEIISKLI